MKSPEWWDSGLQLRFTPSSIRIISLICFSLATAALSRDSQPGDCEPRHCGNGLNISYPFRISEGSQRQPSYCGYPGFDITCKDGDAIVSDERSQFIVQEISYENKSAVISNVDFSSSSCPYPRHNLSLPATYFHVSSVNWDLFFYLNCTRRFPGMAEIRCAEGGERRFSIVARQANDDASRLCGSVVVSPVLPSGAINFSSYGSLLRGGFLLEWTAPAGNCSRCESTGGRCGYNQTTDEFMCICSDTVHLVDCESRITFESVSGSSNKRRIIIGITAGGSGFLLMCTFLACLIYKKYSNLSSYLSIKSRTSQNVEAFLEQHGSIIPRRYKFVDIKKMTRCFDEKLGQGGYGTVYKGKLLNGKLVAVKLLSKFNENGEEFINEVASIGRTHHINIVCLVGFCFEGSKRALIYEFMPNGSLEKFIFMKNPRDMTLIGWKKLLEIAVGIARGLEYLHRGCNARIVHFDIKPHNILLDEDFCPKISDFGLAKSCRPKQSILSIVGARGTIGYIAPEVFSRRFGVISSKSDVYSYGMMVLEMVGGRKNVDVGTSNTNEIYFPHWIYDHFNEDILKFSGITSETEEEVRKMILVGLWCIQTSPSSRPTMSKVIEMLEGNFKDLQMPPKPYLSSP